MAVELYFRHYLFPRNKKYKKEIVSMLNLEQFLQINKMFTLKGMGDLVSSK